MQLPQEGNLTQYIQRLFLEDNEVMTKRKGMEALRRGHLHGIVYGGSTPIWTIYIIKASKPQN